MKNDLSSIKVGDSILLNAFAEREARAVKIRYTVDALRILIPLLLWVAFWMIADSHRTAAIVLLLSSIAAQLIAVTLEQYRQ